MPSSATITAFYRFNPGTRPTYSQMNTNFSNFRGHLIPIHPTNALAVDNTYDMASAEYYWRVGFHGEIDLRTSTSTATLRIKGDTSDTTGAFLLQVEGNSKSAIRTTGLDGKDINPQSMTIGSVFSRGTGQTSTVADGKIGISPTFSVLGINVTDAGTTGTYHVANSTVTVTSIGRPVRVGMFGKHIQIENDASALQPNSCRGTFFKDGVSAASFIFSFGINEITTSALLVGGTRPYRWPLNMWTTLFGVTAGAHNYSFAIIFSDTSTILSLDNAQMCAFEM